MATDGVGYCWGNGADFRLGTGSELIRPAPPRVSGEIDWESISTGQSHSCGVATDGAAYCWGLGDDGRLGTGNELTRNVPTRVSGS